VLTQASVAAACLRRPSPPGTAAAATAAASWTVWERCKRLAETAADERVRERALPLAGLALGRIAAAAATTTGGGGGEEERLVAALGDWESLVREAGREDRAAESRSAAVLSLRLSGLLGWWLRVAAAAAREIGEREERASGACGAVGLTLTLLQDDDEQVIQ
jgi:hypothetical protein